MAQRAITDIADSIEQEVKFLTPESELDGMRKEEILLLCQELREKAHDICVDIGAR